MPKLVARFAENAFWLGRYIERSENIARIIDVNAAFARDEAGEADWKSVVALYADLEAFDNGERAFTAEDVAYFYLLDRDNPNSVRAGMAQARENARAIRHLISTEMWADLNMAFNEMRGWTRREVRSTALAETCARIVTDCQTFEGIAEGTFRRGEPWLFYQLGKLLERADQTTRVLDIGHKRLDPGADEPLASVYWNALLRAVSGFHAFRNRHSVSSGPSDVARFLLYDREFPRAVALCIEQASERLRSLEARHEAGRREPVEAARRALEFRLETGPEMELTGEALHVFLDQLQMELGRMSTALAQSFFR
ncbi:MAG: alpha-E domain-containing protein [Pseudomonadota bacterium]